MRCVSELKRMGQRGSMVNCIVRGMALASIFWASTVAYADPQCNDHATSTEDLAARTIPLTSKAVRYSRDNTISGITQSELRAVSIDSSNDLHVAYWDWISASGDTGYQLVYAKYESGPGKTYDSGIDWEVLVDGPTQIESGDFESWNFESGGCKAELSDCSMNDDGIEFYNDVKMNCSGTNYSVISQYPLDIAIQAVGSDVYLACAIQRTWASFDQYDNPVADGSVTVLHILKKTTTWTSLKRQFLLDTGASPNEPVNELPYQSVEVELDFAEDGVLACSWHTIEYDTSSGNDLEIKNFFSTFNTSGVEIDTFDDSMAQELIASCGGSCSDELLASKRISGIQIAKDSEDDYHVAFNYDDITASKSTIYHEDFSSLSGVTLLSQFAKASASYSAPRNFGSISLDTAVVSGTTVRAYLAYDYATTGAYNSVELLYKDSGGSWTRVAQLVGNSDAEAAVGQISVYDSGRYALTAIETDSSSGDESFCVWPGGTTSGLGTKWELNTTTTHFDLPFITHNDDGGVITALGTGGQFIFDEELFLSVYFQDNDTSDPVGVDNVTLTHATLADRDPDIELTNGSGDTISAFWFKNYAGGSDYEISYDVVGDYSKVVDPVEVDLTLDTHAEIKFVKLNDDSGGGCSATLPIVPVAPPTGGMQNALLPLAGAILLIILGWFATRWKTLQAEA